MRSKRSCAAYCSPVSALIDDYNGSFYYDSPEAIYDAYATGSWSSSFCDSDLDAIIR